jgi:hypothetical protein
MELKIWNVIIVISLIVITIGIVSLIHKSNELSGDVCPSYAYPIMAPTGPGCATTLHLGFKTVKRK